jgi:hypothetical protein
MVSYDSEFDLATYPVFAIYERLEKIYKSSPCEKTNKKIKKFMDECSDELKKEYGITMQQAISMLENDHGNGGAYVCVKKEKDI